MSLIGSIFGDRKMPRRYGGCTCQCHRVPGVYHVMACCSIKDEIDENQSGIYVVEGEKKNPEQEV